MLQRAEPLNYADVEIMSVQAAYSQDVISRQEATADLMNLGLDYFEALALIEDWD